MKSYQHTFLLLLCLAFARSSFCQEAFLTLSGTITDAGTHAPVSFANIQLRGGSAGTVSNNEGNFVFKVPARQQHDTLLISCIGYKTLALPVSAASLAGAAIQLQPAVVELKEVAVSARDGFAILKAAIEKIPQNMDTTDVQLVAFYRENVWLEQQPEGLSFSESVLDIRKTFGTGKKHNDQIRIIKGRKKEFRHKFEHGTDAQFYHSISNISNTARSALGEDLQKYRFSKVAFLNPRNFRHYYCNYLESIRENDRTLLVLEVLPRKNARMGIVRGKVYIDEASMAIVKYDITLSPAGIRYVNRHGKGGWRYTITSKIIRATLDFTGIHHVVTYKHYNGRWYLGSVQRNWEAVLNSPMRRMKDRPWKADMTLVVTDINKDSVTNFAGGNISSSDASISSLIGNNYDPAFWEHYNILQPVLPDSLKHPQGQHAGVARDSLTVPAPRREQAAGRASNRDNGFTRADTLRGQLSPLRSCYDVTFYHLDVAVDMEQRSVKGSNLLRYKVLAPFNEMQVDLYANMKIEKILYRGRPLPYTREYDAVFIRFPGQQPAGTEQEITIYYEGVPKTPDWSVSMDGGVLWSKDEAGNPWAQMVCQGSGASLWWPNKDHLSDEPDSMRIWITVPENYTEISNGRLLRKTPMPGRRLRYEWYVSYPINNYNVTFSIGKYAHYTDVYRGRDTLTVDYYVMPYNLERARKMFRQVKPMLACYEKCFGPYPFPRDGFTLVESLYPMEHQSGVCIGKITEKNAVDHHPLLWHESAHEWWGNAISCKDIADMWMHEAFATYAEALVTECRYGKEEADGYIREQALGIVGREPVTGVYDVNHIHYNIDDMYSKGSLMLHAFRQLLNNDTLWFGLLHGIQEHFRYRTLSAAELVQYINRRTRGDYTWFFDQYLHYAALPKLETGLTEQGPNLVLKYRWVAGAKGFRLPVKVTVAPDKFGVIYPTTEWKTMTLKNMAADEFEVDDKLLLADVEETD